MRRILWLFVAAVLVGSCDGGGGDDAAEAQPTITYDGASAVYSGPEPLTEGIHTFRLENNSDHVVDFGVGRLDPEAVEGVTLEDAVEWGLTEVAAPPWIESYSHLAQVVQGGDVLEARGTVIAGNTYEIAVWDVSTQDAHVAVWLGAVESAG